MKTCRYCKAEKDEALFPKVGARCKACTSARKKIKYAANRELNREKSKAYYQANKDRLKAAARAYRAANLASKRKSDREYYQANKDKLKAYGKAYYYANKERVLSGVKEYVRNRRRNDPFFRLVGALRRHAQRALKPYGKDTRTEQLLGLPYEDFHALWEARCEHAGLTPMDAVVDHLVPLAAAKTKTEAELMSHWSNLQPLTAEENAVKSDNMTPAIERRYNEIRGVAWLLDALQGD